MADDRHSDSVNDVRFLCVSEHYAGKDLILPAVEGISVENPAQANIKYQYD